MEARDELKDALPLERLAREPFDVAVLGAGPAGSAAALALARRGLAVLLVERARFPRSKVCGACLDARALRTLAELGLGALPAQLGAPMLRELECRSGGRGARVALAGGAVLSRERLDHALARAALEAGAHVSAATRALACTLDARAGLRCIALSTPEGESMARARIVVVATGLGAALEGVPLAAARPDARVGAGAIVEAQGNLPPAGCVLMCAARSGYVGAVRLEDGRLCFAAAFDARALRAAAGPGALARAILEGERSELAPHAERGRWRGTPALTRRAALLAGDRIFLCGDAAGFVEPFTGQGIAWALASGAAVAEPAERGVRAYEAGLGPLWERRWRELVRERQRASRALAWLLRRPRATRATLWIASRSPRLSGALAARLAHGGRNS